MEATQTTREVLPIMDFHDEIMECSAPYIIVEAETGSGKSTMVPQWYHERGLKVLVTEPLIETVIGTSEYVAELVGCQFGTTVGYRTAELRCDSQETKILYCTDGLALVRSLGGHGQFDVLVIDELHQWNTNQSTLEAWTWKFLQEGTLPFKKVVVLSATIDSAELSRKRGNAPVFKVPGRQYPIEDRPKGMTLEGDVCKLVAEGFDVLVFQPGWAEIQKCMAVLEGLNAEVIPFHSGQLDRSEKDRAYRAYARPKVVVSTNALETGRTLLPSPGRKLAVVDSGEERRVELRDGVEVLALGPISKAQSKQRRGRTGRVGDGVYIDHCSGSRPEYPTPEILRTRLDQTVLRLAVAGYDAAELPFFHEVDRTVITDAKRALRALGATEDDSSVTKIGRLMARLPVSVQYSRMIVEGERLGVVDDVIIIAAMLEVGGIRDRGENWRYHTAEKESDLLAELDLWRVAQGKKGEDLREMGIFAKSYFKTRDAVKNLREVLRSHRVEFGSTGARQDILRACVAGMVDHLFHRTYGNMYKNGGNGDRQLARESVVSSGPEWVVGQPKDIEFKDRRGYKRILNLVSFVSKVDPLWLAEVAPQLVKIETGLNPRYNVNQDSVVSMTRTIFNGQVIAEDQVPDPNHQKATELFAAAVSSLSDFAQVATHNRTIREQADALYVRSGGHTRRITSQDETAQYWLHFEEYGVVSQATLAQAIASGRISVSDLQLRLEDFISAEEQTKVATGNPDTIEVLGKQLPVTYRSGYNPSAMLEGTIQESDDWKRLPEKVLLPGGRVVTVIIKIDSWQTFQESNLSLLKETVRKHLNKKQLDACVSSAPTIQLPGPSTESVPEIVEHHYGADVLTGEPLIRYGTVAVTTGFYRSSEFQAVWYDTRVEAETARAKAIERFDSLAAERQKARELEQVKLEAQPIKERIDALTREYEHKDVLPNELRYELRERAWSSRPSTVAEIRQWIAGHQAVIAKVEAVIVERQKREQLRYEYQEAEFALGVERQTYLLVTEGGTMFVGATKHNSIGSLDVEPMVQDVACDERVSLDDEGKVSRWHCIPQGEQVMVRSLSGRGNLNSEVLFRSPEAGMLATGVWAVATDDKGILFYPAIYYRERREVIPEEVTVVRERQRPAVAGPSGDMADALAALKAHLGENAVSSMGDKRSQRQRLSKRNIGKL